MKYKGFDIKEVMYNGTRWIGIYQDGRQLVNYTEYMGKRTGSSVPVLCLDTANAKRLVNYMIKSGTVKNHI